eukprot:3013361-Ditylum_brightwellii.AAC.1
MPKPVSSTDINVNDGTEVISHSLLSDDGYLAPTAAGFKSYLQGIFQPLDRQAWSEIVHSMTSYHVHLVEASRKAKFSSWFPSKDEPKKLKLMHIAAEGDHALKDAICPIGE